MNPFNRRSYSGVAPDTTLSAGIDATTLTISVTSGTGWPDGTGGPFEVIFEPDTASEEKCWASARSGNSITLLARGMEGAATSHAGTTTVVRHGYSALDADEANNAVSQTIGQIAAKGDLLVGSGANTLTKVSAGATGTVPIWQSDGSVAAGAPAPAAHTHAEADVTSLSTDLSTLTSGKMANPTTAWAKGSVLVGTGAGTYDTLAAGAEGTVPTVQADGTVAFGVPGAALSYLDGSRTTDFSLTPSTVYIALTTGSLAAGVWLVTGQVCVSGLTSSASVEIEFVVGSGTATILGPASATRKSGAGDETLSVTTLVSVTATAVLDLSVEHNSSVSATLKAATPSNSWAQATGYTAVKVA